MSDTAVYDRTVGVLRAALEQAHSQGAKGQPKPDLADAVRVTWQLVDLALDSVRAQGRSHG